MTTLFNTLPLSAQTLEILEKLGFENSTPIQDKTIQEFFAHDKDILWQAKTWTWKTAAFSLPVIESINQSDSSTQALILTPTRELAIQIAKQVNDFIWKRWVVAFPIYGWQSMQKEYLALRKWVQIIIWTPGRVVDHIKNRKIKLDKLKYFVLDEVDEMLNMGFIEDIDYVFSECPDNRRVMFFSATMPSETLNLVKKYTSDFVHVKVQSKPEDKALIQQHFYYSYEEEKAALLQRLLLATPDFYGIVFCRRKVDVDDLAHFLLKHGCKVESLHGDIWQKQREQVLEKFKNRHIKVLLATDVAARWIDVQNLTHVVNYGFPENSETYTHRIWRTWRAGKTWIAISFVTPREYGRFKSFNRQFNGVITQLEIPTDEAVFNARKESIIDWVNSDTHHVAPYYAQLWVEMTKSFPAKDLIGLLLQRIYGNIELPPVTVITPREGWSSGGDRGGRRFGGSDRRWDRWSRFGWRSRDWEPRGERREGGFSSRWRSDSYSDSPRSDSGWSRERYRSASSSISAPRERDSFRDSAPRGERREGGFSSDRREGGSRDWGFRGPRSGWERSGGSDRRRSGGSDRWNSAWKRVYR